MKSSLAALLAVLSAAVLPVASFAQATAAPDQPARGGRGMGHGNRATREAVRAALTPEEFSRLKAARRAAMADPAVQSAWKAGDRRGARLAMRDAMLRADPQIGPVMQKAMAARRAAGGGRGKRSS